MGTKVVALAMSVALIAATFGFAFVTKSVEANEMEPYLEVIPNEYKTAKQINSWTFNITVWLNEITTDKNLTGVQFDLYYNTTLLEIVGVTEGPFLPMFGSNKGSISNTSFMYATDLGPFVEVADYLLPNATTSDWPIFPEGSGEIATITFQAMYQKGNCTLELDNVLMIRRGDDNDPITPGESINGYYEILLGDLNHDKKVDIKDIAMAAQAFGSYGPDYEYPGSPPHSRWNPEADINNDNKVDLRDIVIIAKNFGEKL